MGGREGEGGREGRRGEVAGMHGESSLEGLETRDILYTGQGEGKAYCREWDTTSEVSVNPREYGEREEEEMEGCWKGKWREI